MRKPLKGEAAVKRAVEDLLTAEKIRFYRMNAGDRFGEHKGKTWRIKGHAKGTPDILATPTIDSCLNTSVFRVKVLLWIEVKAPGKKPTDEQSAFAYTVIADGERWILVDDVSQLQKWLRENRAR